MRIQIFLMIAGCLLLQLVYSDAELIDGSVIKGKILRETDSTMVFETILGEQCIPKEKIRRILIGKDSLTAESGGEEKRVARYLLDPHRQGLTFLPTAFVPPKGTVYFKDFELLFLTLGMAVTGSTALMVGTLFPMNAEFQLLTLGFKQQIYVEPDQSRALALTGAITIPTEAFNHDDYEWMVHMVFSLASAGGSGLHLSGGFKGARRMNGNLVWNGATGAYESRTEYPSRAVLGAGTDLLLTEHLKIIAEIFNHAPFVDERKDAYYSSVGVRLFWSRMSADIAGLRPLTEGWGVFLIPIVNIGCRF